MTSTTTRNRIVIVVLALAAILCAVTIGAHAVWGQTDPGPSTGGDDDGELAAGTTLDDDVPGITNLDPALLNALRAAAEDASEEGIEFVVNSGWRSVDYQRRLIDEAIADYGSWDVASRWVATPSGSAHVTGDAADIGGYDAAAWLQENGSRYDLCQVFDNEAWHFELRPGASTDRCPPMYWDASDDPRNQS